MAHQSLRRKRGVGMTRPSFCTTANERVYITARACELEFGATKGLQAPGAGGRVSEAIEIVNVEGKWQFSMKATDPDTHKSLLP